MLFAPIVPLSMLETIRDDPYHMILAPLCRFKEYANFYQQAKGFKMLDNGAAEGASIDVESLLRFAQELKVNEVIIPDAYDDMPKTHELLLRFMPFANDFHVMAVMQCHTWTEFDVIFHVALDNNVDTLALPRVMCEHLGPSARLAGAELIRRFSDIPIHALGSTPHLREARDLARQGIVRGIDTSAPVVQGLENLDIRSPYKERPTDFFFAESTTMARLNIERYRSWCQETPPVSTL